MRALSRVFKGRRSAPLQQTFNALTAALFRGGEQGLAFDPNDLSTLFQDLAMAVPVTAAGQPVRVMLDKSGRGNHVTFLSDAARPFLRLNATTGAYYLEADGSDDGGVTPSIDFTGADEVSVFAGVRKLSDAARAVVLELSVGGQAGSFRVEAPSSPAQAGFAFMSQGSSLATASASAITAAVSAVIYGVGKISTDTATLAVNGVLVAQSSSDQGTGNYGNYPLHLFRRGLTTLPWAGHFYGLIIVGRLTTATETNKVQRLFAKRTGGTLA